MKKRIGKDGILPAMPVSLIATEHDSVLNFAPHGQIGTVTAEPSVVYTSVIKEHRTAQNILATGRFSVNIPGAALLPRLIHCGAVSGADADKSGAFEVFYGESGVPMVADCGVCFACKLVHTHELSGFYLFLGEVLETYADEALLTDGMPDVRKVQPLLCSIDGSFWIPGAEIAAEVGE